MGFFEWCGLWKRPLFSRVCGVAFLQGVSKGTYQYTGIITVIYWYVSFEAPCTAPCSVLTPTGKSKTTGNTITTTVTYEVEAGTGFNWL